MAPEPIRSHGRGGVLVVTTHYHPIVGGVETHARQLASGFRARHRPVVVLTTRVIDPPTRQMERKDGVSIVRAWPATGRQGLTKWLFAPVVFVAAWRLRRHYAVIYLPDLRGLALPAVAAGRLVGRPVVLQGATPGAFSMGHWDRAAPRGLRRLLRPAIAVAKAVVRAGHRRASAICCLTREHADEARAAGIAADQITYVPHGVDTDRFHPSTAAERHDWRVARGWPTDRPVVVFLGRLSAEKGLLDVLEAWRMLGDERALLVIVGPDMTGHPLDAGPAARAFAQTHLPGRVRFDGPTDDAPAVLRAADVLVHPSHYEAFPLTVLEAMASATAVVATFVGGLRDYLVDGANALVCPPQDPARLASALARVLADEGLRHRLAAAGPRTVSGRFDLGTNLDTYAALFDRLGADRMRPAP